MFLSCNTYWRDIFISIYVFAFVTGYQYAYSLHISWNRKRKLKKKTQVLTSNGVQWDLRLTNCRLLHGTWWYCIGASSFLPISKLNTTTLVSAVTIQYFIMWRNIMSIPLCQYWRSLYWPFSKREIW